MATIEGLQNVERALKHLADKAKRECSKSVIVGYTANYALYVHENVEMKLAGQPRAGRHEGGRKIRNVKTGRFTKGRGFFWDPQGIAQAKFLEGPARQFRKELGRIAATVFKRTKRFDQALLAAGLRLQRESQKRVPVDTGNLKNSAVTKFDDNPGTNLNVLAVNA